MCPAPPFSSDRLSSSFSGQSSAIVAPPGTAPLSATPDDPLQTAQGVYVAIHGHFYQPPRENPYLETIEPQKGPEPFENWNERIYWECYRPNAFARVLSNHGLVLDIVNNFEYLSFNVGPTLMNWLETYDPEVYGRIVAGDRLSCERLQGHGNAIAQVYNHIILPLANDRDKRTQIRWGKADFYRRFGRQPEGMWLAETAVDYPTLEALVEEGIRFIILAPSQAQRCRPLPTPGISYPPWQTVSGGQIDPTRPYRCFLRGRHPMTPTTQPFLLQGNLPLGEYSAPFIDIFFYDGPISRDMGFTDLLGNVQTLCDRINLAIKGDQRPSQIIGMATDGETFGHHRKGTEKCLAYGFTRTFPDQGWTVTNFAHYLSLHSPTWEVELKPMTAWSCSHGVDRWQGDCGCGREGDTHQRWRQPLRQALDWLRDQLAPLYESLGSQWLMDPWEARDAYIQVVGDRHPHTVSTFLQQYQTHNLRPEEQVDVLRLLEMQRHCLLMYTSCGWFFDELSRPEGVQILCYAARALKLAGEVSGIQLEAEFIHRLALAPSNSITWVNGAEIYHHLVKPSQLEPEQIVAHYGIGSLFPDAQPKTSGFPPIPSLAALVALGTVATPHPQQLYCYTIYGEDYQLQRLGALTLAIGQVRLVSAITWESYHLIFAVLHLGGWDFHCCIQGFAGRLHYGELKQQLFQSLQAGSAAHIILTLNRLLKNPHIYTLQDLFGQERHRIMHHLTAETLDRLNQLYSQVYRSNYGILMAFYRDGLPVPRELQVAAEIALTYRIQTAMGHLSQGILANPEVCCPLTPILSTATQQGLIELEEIAPEITHLHCQLRLPEAQKNLEQLICCALGQMLREADPQLLPAYLRFIKRLLALGETLQLFPSLAKAQELLCPTRSHQWSGALASYLPELARMFQVVI